MWTRVLRAFKYLWWILVAIAGYLAVIVIAIKANLISRAIALVTYALVMLQAPPDQISGMASDLVSSLLQAFTFGLIIFGVTVLLRALDTDRKRSFLAEQVCSDYEALLETLGKIRSYAVREGGVERDNAYLRQLLGSAESRVRRLQSRPWQFLGVIEIKALRHFEAAVRALDNIVGFIGKARSWNDGLGNSRPHGFSIYGVKTSDDPHAAGTPALSYLDAELMAFLKNLKRSPGRRKRRELRDAVGALAVPETDGSGEASFFLPLKRSADAPKPESVALG